MERESEEGESKIVYLEGSEVRAIRGKILDDDGFFIKIRRREGHIFVSKGVIVKIEEVI